MALAAHGIGVARRRPPFRVGTPAATTTSGVSIGLLLPHDAPRVAEVDLGNATDSQAVATGAS